MATYDSLIFLHGLESSSGGYKARYFRQILPGIVTPDFRGSLDERMAALRPILRPRSDWIIIGSSFGGLMATLYAGEKPAKVQGLILLAPALSWGAFAGQIPNPIELPVILIHGQQDELIPIDTVRSLAEKIFLDLDFRPVDDDHRLQKTVRQVDWVELINALQSANG